MHGNQVITLPLRFRACVCPQQPMLVVWVDWNGSGAHAGLSGCYPVPDWVLLCSQYQIMVCLSQVRVFIEHVGERWQISSASWFYHVNNLPLGYFSCYRISSPCRRPSFDSLHFWCPFAMVWQTYRTYGIQLNSLTLYAFQFDERNVRWRASHLSTQMSAAIFQDAYTSKVGTQAAKYQLRLAGLLSLHDRSSCVTVGSTAIEKRAPGKGETLLVIAACNCPLVWPL